MHPLRRPWWPARVPLRWKIAALAAATACLVALAVGVLVHVWTAMDVRSRAEMEATNTVYSAMDVYRRTGTLAGGAELDPADLPTALRHPADGDRRVAYDGRVEGNLGPSVWGAQRIGGPGSPVLAVRINMSPQLHDLRRLDASMAVASSSRSPRHCPWRSTGPGWSPADCAGSPRPRPGSPPGTSTPAPAPHWAGPGAATR